MRTTILIAVLIASLAVNAAVFQHHYFTAEHISAKNRARTSLKETKKPGSYTFHYAGEERWNNVFAIYRCNKETGEILRYSYTMYDKAKDGTPAHDSVKVLNMKTGASKSFVSEEHRHRLVSHFDEQLKKARKKKDKKEPVK